MRIVRPQLPGGLLRWRRCCAFTLSDLMISVGLLLMLVLAFVSAQIFGGRLLNVSEIRLASTDGLPTLNNWLLNDLRSGKTVQVGQGNSNSFSPVGLTGLQQGNSLQIYPTTNPSVYIRYYLDAADNQLKRLGTDQVVTVLGGTITNAVLFTAESAAGTVLTNRQNSQVIGVYLVYAGLTNAGVQLGGSNNYYNSYQLQFKVASRTQE